VPFSIALVINTSSYFSKSGEATVNQHFIIKVAADDVI